MARQAPLPVSRAELEGRVLRVVPGRQRVHRRQVGDGLRVRVGHLLAAGRGRGRERGQHAEDDAAVLHGHHPAGGERAAVPVPFHLVESRLRAVAAGARSSRAASAAAGLGPPSARPRTGPAPRPGRRTCPRARGKARGTESGSARLGPGGAGPGWRGGRSRRGLPADSAGERIGCGAYRHPSQETSESRARVYSGGYATLARGTARAADCSAQTSAMAWCAALDSPGKLTKPCGMPTYSVNRTGTPAARSASA